MVIVTYDNFRELECEFAKYVSQKKNKFKINILRFPAFKEELLSTFSEEEIQNFFDMFHYAMDTDVTGFDILTSIRIEVEFYDDLCLMERKGHEFVLVDQSSEILGGMDFLREFSTQPIVFQEFAAMSFLDFARISQKDLLYSINFNLRDRENGQSKYIEKEIKEGLYI